MSWTIFDGVGTRRSSRRIFAGGYTTFIVSYLFNSDACTLNVLNHSPTGNNPSWIASHPTNRSIL
jgi:hypothetical protein